MAIGDNTDVLNRLLATTPNWFGSNYPNLTALLQAYVSTGVFAYEQVAYVRPQTRIKTATGDNLDVISNDYFGNMLPRLANEGDDQFRNRILAYLLLERATRPGIKKALELLVGVTPIMFEPWYAPDTGGYNIPSTMGYDIAGRYGSASYPYQGFIDIYLPHGTGYAGFAGYNTFLMGYSSYGGLARGYYSGISDETDDITDEAIYNVVLGTKAEGTIVWVRIHRGDNPPVSSLLLDDNNDVILDNDGNMIFV